jgi:hypothetical protein
VALFCLQKGWQTPRPSALFHLPAHALGDCQLSLECSRALRVVVVFEAIFRYSSRQHNNKWLCSSLLQHEFQCLLSFMKLFVGVKSIGFCTCNLPYLTIMREIKEESG